MFPLSHRLVRYFVFLFLLVFSLPALGQSDLTEKAQKKISSNGPIQEGEESAPIWDTYLRRTNIDTGTKAKDLPQLYAQAKKGDANAQFVLGMKTLEGAGLPQSTRLGVEWLRRAAKQNHSEANYQLFIYYASHLGLPLDAQNAKELLDESIESVKKAFGSDKLTKIQKALLLENYLDAYDWAVPNTDRKIKFDILKESFDKGVSEASTRHYVEGVFYVHYAWDARTDKWAHEVTPEQFREFGNRLLLAKMNLEKAYDLDPNNFLAAAKMIPVTMGLCAPREVMEKWFDRATKANPELLYAYSTKMNYLESKWMGSPEEMLEFGRECVQKGQWNTKIPFRLIDAHHRLSAYYPKQPSWNPNEAPLFPYFQEPGVWEDIQLVFQGYLKAWPKDKKLRTQYARYACMCQKWRVAREQFQILGDEIVKSVFRSEAELEIFKSLALR